MMSRSYEPGMHRDNSLPLVPRISYEATSIRLLLVLDLYQISKLIHGFVINCERAIYVSEIIPEPMVKSIEFPRIMFHLKIPWTK